MSPLFFGLLCPIWSEDLHTRIRGHNHLLDELKGHSVLGKLLLGVVPANEAVSYAHQNHQSIFNYDPKASASKAYAQFVGKLVQRIAQGVNAGLEIPKNAG